MKRNVGYLWVLAAGGLLLATCQAMADNPKTGKGTEQEQTEQALENIRGPKLGKVDEYCNRAVKAWVDIYTFLSRRPTSDALEELPSEVGPCSIYMHLCSVDPIDGVTPINTVTYLCPWGEVSFTVPGTCP